MKDPNLSAFIEDLGRAYLFQKGEGVTDNFKKRYRREIIVMLSMLHDVELFGSPTSLHPDPPELCDLCEDELAQWRWFVDCCHGENGEWGNLCQPCFIDHGGILRWGRGQRYLRTADRQWRCVAGGDPKADKDSDSWLGD